MRIVHEKYKCIGCGTCISVCPSLFKMGSDGRAYLKEPDIEYNKEREEEVKIVEQAGCAKEAADICPVQCIRIEK
jgi:ferredoxin